MTKCKICGIKPKIKYTGVVYFVIGDTQGCRCTPKDKRLIKRFKTEFEARRNWAEENGR